MRREDEQQDHIFHNDASFFEVPRVDDPSIYSVNNTTNDKKHNGSEIQIHFDTSHIENLIYELQCL